MAGDVSLTVYVRPIYCDFGLSWSISRFHPTGPASTGQTRQPRL